MNDLLNIAHKVHELETNGFQISSAWYELEPAEDSEIQTLHAIVRESLAQLEKLSDKINHVLSSTITCVEFRDHMQYAYNLTQELIQSRASVLEMLQNLDSTATHEYLRALAIKERAAESQSQTLAHTLSTVH